MNIPHAGKIGLGLMVLSCILYAGLLLIPFMGLSIKGKATMAGGLILMGEVTFWLGCLIAGKELMTRYRQYLNPVRWFRKGGTKTQEKESNLQRVLL